MTILQNNLTTNNNNCNLNNQKNLVKLMVAKYDDSAIDVGQNSPEVAKMKRDREQAYFNSYDFDAITRDLNQNDNHTCNNNKNNNNNLEIISGQYAECTRGGAQSVEKEFCGSNKELQSVSRALEHCKTSGIGTIQIPWPMEESHRLGAMSDNCTRYPCWRRKSSSGMDHGSNQNLSPDYVIEMDDDAARMASAADHLQLPRPSLIKHHR